MSYDHRQHQPRTDTTRHLDSHEAGESGVTGYLEGARHRSARFAQTTAQLRDIRAEINSLGREAHSRPTGVLSGGDVDIAYHYLGVGVGVIATIYSVVGTIFALNGGSDALIATVMDGWNAGPAAALTNALLNFRTLGAVLLQVVLFIVLIGTRRNPRSWQHIAALVGSAALTYAGWSGLLMSAALAPVAAFTATVPAVLIGAALGWVIVRGTNEAPLARPLLIGVLVAGFIAGGLGSAALIHWVGALLAWSADQVARRIMVVG